jgi:hypothetical protein
MGSTKTYANYPMWIVTLSNSVSILIYISGVILTLQLGWIAAALYLIFILAFEYRLLSKHCVNCFYWGKVCGFGKGRISALLFKKGKPSKFCAGKFTWKDLIPDLLISLIPLVAGIVFMIINFQIILLFAAIALAALSTFGTGFIRGNFTCKYCKQRELGCPAEQFFSKGKPQQQ